MRPLLLAAPLFVAPLLVGAAGLENGTNRSGGDFRDFETSANPADCQAACKTDESCRSFTWVKPGVQGPKAHCWLKSIVAAVAPDANCTSGVVERAAPKAGDLEWGVNRAGRDYRNFESGAKPDECRAACNAEPQCRSFTWVKPGAQGAKSHCWLKNDVPPPTPDGNCVSGLAVHAPGTGGCGCVATTCAAACKDAIVMLCVAGGTTKDDGAACQKCIDSNCPAK